MRGFMKVNNSKLIQDALTEFEKVMAGILDWMTPLYDNGCGGFHLAHSSLTDTEKYFCSLWETILAVRLLENVGLLSSMPDSMKQALISYFQSKQDPEEGYFYDKVRFQEKRFTSRVTGASKQTLEELGAQPLYPMPDDSKIFEKYEELTSTAAFSRWLKGLDWSNPYMAAATIGDVSPLIDKLSEPLRTQIIDTLWTFIESIQSDKTGFWGSDPDEMSFAYTSGAMKLDNPSRRFNRSIDKADKLFQSSLKVLRTQKSDYILDYRNIATVFRLAGSYLGNEIKEEDVAEIVSLITAEIKRFLHPDGGFSRFVDKPYYGEERLVLSKGLAEGDMNSVGNIVQMRKELYTLAGMECPEFPGVEGFYKKLII